MVTLIDTSLWIALTRKRSPRHLKAFIEPYVDDAGACLAEPIVFEVLRHATDAEAASLMRYFASIRLLPSPPNL